MCFAVIFRPRGEKPSSGSFPPAGEAFAGSARKALLMDDHAARVLYSPRQLPDLDGSELLLAWDQEDADTIVRHGERVVWRETTGWEVYERFAEMAAILQRKYGRRLKDLAPTPRSRYALLGDSSRASAHVEAARAALGRPAPPGREYRAAELTAAIRDGDGATVHEYLAQGGNPDARDEATGASLLQTAARWRQPGIARALIASGADVNFRGRSGAIDREDTTPLETTKETGIMAEDVAAAPGGGSDGAGPEPEAHPEPLEAWFRVRCDEHGLTFGASPPGGVSWSEEIAWGDIVRVCYLTGGMFESDELYLFTTGRAESYVIPTEANGGKELVDALLGRGLFSPDLMLEAVATEGELFCWPPAGTEQDIGE
jgi:hypothetical protein